MTNGEGCSLILKSYLGLDNNWSSSSPRQLLPCPEISGPQNDQIVWLLSGPGHCLVRTVTPVRWILSSHWLSKLTSQWEDRFQRSGLFGFPNRTRYVVKILVRPSSEHHPPDSPIWAELVPRIWTKPPRIVHRFRPNQFAGTPSLVKLKWNQMLKPFTKPNRPGDNCACTDELCLHGWRKTEKVCCCWLSWGVYMFLSMSNWIYVQLGLCSTGALVSGAKLSNRPPANVDSINDDKREIYPRKWEVKRDTNPTAIGYTMT